MEKNNKHNFVNIQILGIAVMLVVITTIVLTVSLTGLVSQVAQWVDPAQRELYLARETALQETKIASAKVDLYVSMAFQLALLLGVISAGIVGLRWMHKASMKTYAQNGLFPVIEKTPGVFYDPNRSLGENPIVTLGALKVQEMAAIQSDKIMVTYNNGDSQPMQALSNPQSTLPEMLPVSSVGQKNYTLDNLTIGQGANGILQASLYDLMHILAVGASGFGKSGFLRWFMYQLAQVKEDVGIIGIDAFGSELNTVRNWSKLLYPVAFDVEIAISTLQAVSSEIEARKELYKQLPNAYDLPSYNDLAKAALAPIVVICDEGTSLLAHKGVGPMLARVTQTSRQYGVYLLLAGQNAKASVIDTATRDNFSSKLAFHTSPTSYRTVLGQTVEDVSIRGRAYSILPGHTLELVQVPYVSREQLSNVITTGMPQNDLPTLTQDVTDMQVIEDNPDLPEPERVRLLHSQGLSLRKIQQRVYGYVGGSAFESVKNALGE